MILPWVFPQVPQHPKPRWKADESRLQDAQHSEPWYKAVQGLKPVDARAASMAPVNGNSAEGYAGPTSGSSVLLQQLVFCIDFCLACDFKFVASIP